jgi:hypothetical protein
MNEESACTKQISNFLPCSTIVYRALLSKDWLDPDTGEVTENAYLLRDYRNETKLSVKIAEICTAEKCKSQFSPCFGVASLHVGRIRDIGLDVVADRDDHASIIGLPSKKHDPDRAEQLASKLAEQSRIVL